MDDNGLLGLDQPIGPSIGPYGADTEAMAEGIISGASNVRSGDNPFFGCNNFLSVYPQFGGASTAISITATAASNIVGLASLVGVAVGNLVVDISGNIPDGTTVMSISGNTAILSAQAKAAASGKVLFYPMMVPPMLVQMFLAMATASLMSVRWRSLWQYAMCLYVAHFCTLFLTTQASPNSTAGQVITTAQTMFPASSESVGDVSGSYDTSAILNDLPGWAQWKLTSFGVQLASFAQMVGKGGMCVY